MKLKKERYKELVVVAGKVCDILEKEGVKWREGCVVRRIVENQWDIVYYDDDDQEQAQEPMEVPRA
jgi:hypothetical protein